MPEMLALQLVRIIPIDWTMRSDTNEAVDPESRMPLASITLPPGDSINNLHVISNAFEFNPVAA